MPRGKPISFKKRSVIVAFHQGYSVRQEVTSEKTHENKLTVSDIIRRHQRTSSLRDRARSGRKRKTIHADDERIKLLSKLNKRLTASEIAAEMNRDRAREISLTTVKRRLKDASLHGRIAARKPLFRRGNRQIRLQWTETHRNWTMNDWKRVLWTDESKFEVFGQSRRVSVRRAKGQRILKDCVVSTVKQGRSSVLVWGCISYAGTGDLKPIEGILRKEGYLEILQENAIPLGERVIGEDFVFMQDNEPKHSAVICKNFLNEQQNNGTLQAQPHRTVMG